MLYRAISTQLGFICNLSNELGVNESLLSKPYIQYDRYAWGGAIADTYLIDHNIQTKSVCEIDALESIVLMVKREMGVSLMPIWDGLEDVASNIKVLPIESEKYQRHITLISHRQVGKKPLIKAFSQALLRVRE